MAVAGLPNQSKNHAPAIANMALDMQNAIATFNAENNQLFRIRIGISTGPVVVGVIVSYFLLEPVFSLFVDNLDSIVRLSLFMLVTILISLLTSELRTAKQHLQMSLQKLQVSEAKFRRLVESNIIGVIVANMDGQGKRIQITLDHNQG